MKKIIVQKGLTLLMVYFIIGFSVVLFAQKPEVNFTATLSAAPPIKNNRLVIQFNNNNATNIDAILAYKNATIVESITDFGLNIYLVEFPIGILESFPTIQDAHQYYDCGGGVEDQTKGSSTKVKSVDYEYTITSPDTNPNGNYNLNNYNPNPQCEMSFNLTVSNNNANGVKIAVIDSGHKNGSPFDSIIGNDGYDFIDDDSSPNDRRLHGTKVNSIIAGIVNGYANITITPIKILDENGESSLFTFYQGIVHAISINADIINLSVGTMLDSGDYCTDIIGSIFKAAYQQNILIVAAAGNNMDDIDNNRYLPSSSNASNLLVVGSSSCDDDAISSYAVSDFSNIGNTNVDVFAAGEEIVVYPHGLASGTSFATPQVTAIAAIEALTMTSFDPQVIKSAIINSVTNLGWTDDCVSGGMLNPAGVIQYFDDGTNGYAKSASDESISTTLGTVSQSSSDENGDLNTTAQTDLTAYFSNSNQMELTINTTINQEALIKLISLYGDTVANTKLALSKGTNTYSLQNLNHLPTGVYLVYVLIDGKELITQKCFKQ